MAADRKSLLLIFLLHTLLCEPAASSSGSTTRKQEVFPPGHHLPHQETPEMLEAVQPATYLLVPETKQSPHETRSDLNHDDLVMMPFAPLKEHPDLRDLRTKPPFTEVGTFRDRAGDAVKPSEFLGDEHHVDSTQGAVNAPYAHADKRYFDSIAGSLLKKSHRLKPGRYFDSIAGHLLKRSRPQYRSSFDMIAGSLLKKSDHHTDKRDFDTIAGSLLKKSDPHTDKRDFDMIAGSLLKKSDPHADKRDFDMIAGSLLKRTYPLENRGNFDMIAGNVLKKSQHERKKRSFDSIAGNLLKRSHFLPNRGNLYQKSFRQFPKGNFDFIAGNLLKRFSPRTRTGYFDSIAGNLLKRSSPRTRMGYFDPVAGNLLKRPYHGTSMGSFDSIAGNLLKRPYHGTSMGSFDSIAGNLLKRSPPRTRVSGFDSIAGNLLKRSYPRTNYGNFDFIAGNLLKKSHLRTNMGYFDSIAGNLLKKSSPQSQKRSFDSIAGSLLKKSHPRTNSGNFDFIAGHLLKRSYPQSSKRSFDLVAGNLLKKSSLQRNKRSFDSYPANVLTKTYSQTKRYFDSIAGDLLKKSCHQKSKRYIDSIAGHLFKKSSPQNEEMLSDSAVSEKRFFDSIAGHLIKKSDTVEGIQYGRPVVVDGQFMKIPRVGQDPSSVEDVVSEHFNDDENDSTKRHVLQTRQTYRSLHSLGKPLVRGDMGGGHRYVDIKRFLDWIAGHLLKKRSLDEVETQQSLSHLEDHLQKTTASKPLPDSTKERLTDTDLALRSVKAVEGGQTSAGKLALPEDHSSELTGKNMQEGIDGSKKQSDAEKETQSPIKDLSSKEPNGNVAKLSRQRRDATPYTLSKRHGDLSFSSQAAGDEQFPELESSFDEILGSNNGLYHHQKRFLPLPFLLTQLIIHTLPLSSISTLQKPPASELSGDEQGNNLLTNDLLSGLSKQPFSDSLSDKDTSYLPSDDFAVPVYFENSPELQVVSSNGVRKWHPAKGSSGKWYKGTIPSKLSELDYLNPNHALKPLSHKSFDSDDITSNPVQQQTDSELNGFDLKEPPSSKRSTIALPPDVFQLTTDGVGYGYAKSSKPSNPESGPASAYDGRFGKHDWLHKFLLDSIYDSILKTQTVSAQPHPTAQMHKRFIAPAVWQMLMERSLYHYGGNFLDSIAGDLLKRGQSSDKLPAQS